ncbi:MAG TPA: hypothetical protein VKV27_01750, partial [Solirubrobacteraceae bacterium]|nr:hypothetical protein [Solirubrobacteraceae bacterium]
INSTFRQVGIATGIAGLGALFTHTVTTHIISLLRTAHGVSPRLARSLAHAVSQGGGASSGFGHVPAAARAAALHAVHAGFTTGLNQVFLVGALVSFAAAALTLVLIRSKDFEVSAARSGGGAPAADGADAATEGAGAGV